MFLLTVACLKNPQVVAVPFKREGSYFIEQDLGDNMWDMYIASQPSPPSGRHLSLIWAGLSENGSCIEDMANSSWDRYVIGHARCVGGPEVSTSSIQVCSMCALGLAILCQLRWLTHPVHQNVAAVTASDHTLAHDYIWHTRGEILRQLNTAFHKLVVIKQFHHQSTSYFVTLDVKWAAGDGTSNYNSDCDDSDNDRNDHASDSDYDCNDSNYNRNDIDPTGKRSQASTHKWRPYHTKNP